MMYKKILLVSCFLISGLLIMGQNCDCTKSLDSLKGFIEKNYVGAGDKLNQGTLKDYQLHNSKYQNLVKKFGKNETYCLYLLHAWTAFFKDHHIQVGFSFPVSKLKILEGQREKLMLTPQKIIEVSEDQSRPIEGVYYTADTAYRVAVVKNKIGLRDFAGVIMSTKAPEWQTGQVKFELIKKDDDTYDVIWYNRLHHPTFGNVSFSEKNGMAGFGWFKEGSKEVAADSKPLFDEEQKHITFYQQLDPQTGYLRIRSFNGNFAGAIDSVIKTNQQQITSQPWLIIDLRGNGGGADFSYRPLKQFIYTNPVKRVGVDLLATPDNIKAWEEILKEPDIPEDFKKEFYKKIESLKNNPVKMLNLFDDDVDSSGSVQPFPGKVAIIIDERCASTTEQFLLEAIQSSKVTIFGQPSMGVLDYSNMREKKFYCPEYSLWYSTTRSRRIDIGQGIDNKGIQPHIRLDLKKQDWLQKTLQELKAQK